MSWRVPSTIIAMSAADIPRKIWTRAEADLLPSDSLSLELVNGELIDRMGKKPPHVYWKNILQEWLVANFGFGHVRSEDPIDVAPEDNPTSEPEPDLIVTYRSLKETRGANPSPEDLRLLVEVSDQTYTYDKTVKAALYARAGIIEYWIMDIRTASAPRLLIHLEPREGRYHRVTAYNHESSVEVLNGLQLKLSSLV